jgi:hypothetical protein
MELSKKKVVIKRKPKKDQETTTEIPRVFDDTTAIMQTLQTLNKPSDTLLLGDTIEFQGSDDSHSRTFTQADISLIFEIKEKGVCNMFTAWHYLEIVERMNRGKAKALNQLYLKHHDALESWLKTRLLKEKMKDPANTVFEYLHPKIPPPPIGLFKERPAKRARKE